MPPVIGIVGAIAGAAIAGAAAAGAITATLAIVLTVAVTAATAIAQRALTKKPDRNPIQQQDRTITIRQPIAPWPVWYGESRKGGVIVGPNNFKVGNDVWLVVVWAGHPVQSLGDVFLNDAQIEVQTDGSCEGTFDGASILDKLFVYHHLGSEFPYFFDKVVEDTTASATHQTRQSIAKAASSLTYTLSVFAIAGERQRFMLNASDSAGTNEASGSFDVTTRSLFNSFTGGAGFTFVNGGVEDAPGGFIRCWITITSNTDTTLFLRLFLIKDGVVGTSYTGDGRSGMYFRGAQLEQASALSPYVKTEGAASGANLLLWSEELQQATWLKTRASVTADAIGQEADANLMDAIPLMWTDAHRLLGLAYSVFHFVNQPTNFTTGIPQLSVYGRGHSRIYDPRTGIYGYSTNPILCTRDNLCSAVYGRSVSPLDVDDAGSIPEADHCDDDLPIGPDEDYIYISEYTSASVVSAAADTMGFSPGVAIYTGDEVRLVTDGAGVMPAPLVANTSYWVNRLPGTNNYRFFNNKADAVADTNRIDITTAGTLPVRMWKRDAVLRLGGPEAAITGVDTAQDELDGLSPQIDIQNGHRWRMGSTSTIPGGLIGGQTYFTTMGAGNGVQACLTPGATPINITGTGAGIRTVRIDGSGFKIDAVDLTTGEIDLSAGGALTFDWPTGTRAIFRANGGSAAPLVDGQEYIIIRDGPFVSAAYRIATSRRRAEAGLHVQFTAAVTGAPYLESDYSGMKAWTGALTGDAVKIPGNDIYSAGATDLFWVRVSPTTGRLALTREDALAGITLTFDTEPNFPTGSPTTPPERVEISRISQVRFSCTGEYNAETDMDEVQRGLISSCAGTVLEPVLAGKWRIKAGRYRVPVFNIDTADSRVIGGLTIQSMLPADQAANAIRGVYTAPVNDDQPDDIPEYADAEFQEQDGGEKITKDLLLPFTNSREMALRLAKIELMKARYGRTVAMTAFYGIAPGMEPTDTADLTDAAMGYDGRTFETTSMELALRSDGQSTPTPRMALTLRETAPEVWR